eukprot:scaffold2334_cov118-Cylindrotheca_fusiformis.AAC.17
MGSDGDIYNDDFKDEPMSPKQPNGGLPSAQTLSMNFMKSLSGICCQQCGTDPFGDLAKEDEDAPSELYNLHSMQKSISSVYPLLAAPMASSVQSTSQTQLVLGEYMTLCQFYRVPYNAGVLTTLRYRLPTLRLGGSFHDTDMLAVAELLLKHANGALQYIRRLDFTMAGREGKQDRSIKIGFTSHGALALAKTLQHTKYIGQVWLPKHRIGPYGASALFWACSTNKTIKNLKMRRCRIGERGAFAFCQLLLKETTGLEDVDLSANAIGHRGISAIEEALATKAGDDSIYVNLEGNLVFPECAIYILIAGSYTPFMQILFYDQAIWSVGLLGFLWMCCFLGISVEAFAPTWKQKNWFSLAMYLGMGWAAVACFSQMKERLPPTAMNCLVLGGVGYTAGVPFFIRNNNLDHAIWHLFVMAGSIFHWVCVYVYVAPRPLNHTSIESATSSAVTC